MAEQIDKLTPDRDLQCYFLTPSAIAALSESSPSGFTVSGKWRQQFDWAVVEWNRDNVFEHPALRNLPDGDLSGLVLSYCESRTGCIPIQSSLSPINDWNNLRIWATPASGTETIYSVPLTPLATPAAGSYVPASVTMTLTALPAAGQRVGLALLETHFYATVQSGNQLSDVAAAIAANINSLSQTFLATNNGPSVTMTWNATASGAPYANLLGANGNRITVYGFAESGASVWQQPSATFSGGAFPSQYQITINFANLTDVNGEAVPTNNTRKLRWTWAADLRAESFQQTEFQVSVSQWNVTGNNRGYLVAGPGSRRIEDTDPSVIYNGSWTIETGNYSGSKIHSTSNQGDTCTITYTETAPHQLFVGTRMLASGATVSFVLDSQPAVSVNLNLSDGEDVLVRTPLGTVQPGTHTLTCTNAGPAGSAFYFDFIEIAYPSANLPDFPSQTQLALATDWDTYHSQALPAERTAWLVNKLGYQGRLNHYAGAMYFYEIFRPGTVYASASITFTADLVGNNAALWLDLAGSIPFIQHTVLPDDTPATVAQAFAALINLGTNLLWASASGNQLTMTACAMGTDGNGIIAELGLSTDGGNTLSTVFSSVSLSGGVDGTPYDPDNSDPLYATLTAAADFWRTDLTATPRLNRAARDWHRAYFTALQSYGIEVVTSFSMELMNGDPAASTGIAQQYPDSTPVVLSTPSIQTNFSPASLAYWTQAYMEIASLQSAAGLTPYLQFGEVQWWYNPKTNVGMPFYDAYTQQQFQAQYGVPMQVITNNSVSPSQYPNETSFLPGLIGQFTAAVRSAVLAQYPSCRFEVLYPTDTNDTPLNQVINYPNSDWTPSNLKCLKTESFSFTAANNLDQSVYSFGVSAAKGFPNAQRSHLVGISNAWTSWMKEVNLAQAAGLESVVLFALDQYCLIGYPPPPFVTSTRSQRQG